MSTWPHSAGLWLISGIFLWLSFMQTEYAQPNSIVEDGLKPPTSHQPASIIDVQFVRCTSQQTRPAKRSGTPSTLGTPLAPHLLSYSRNRPIRSLPGFQPNAIYHQCDRESKPTKEAIASARRILCEGRVVTRHGVSTRRLYQLGTLRSWSQPLFLVPSKPWKFWCDQSLTHITIWHYRVSNGVTPIARWFMMENPSINGWFGGTPYDLWNDGGLSQGKS